MTDLVIFSGLPGTGKSTLAHRLARELHRPLLSIDDVVVDVPENADNSFWDQQITALLNLVETQLELDLDVIVDSVFMNMDRHHAQKLAQKYDVRFLPIYVFVSDEKIWEERVTTRFDQSNNPDVATWERIQHQRRHFREWEPDTALFVDTIRPVDETFKQVLDFVTSWQSELKPLPELPLTVGRYHE